MPCLPPWLKPWGLDEEVRLANEGDVCARGFSGGCLLRAKVKDRASVGHFTGKFISANSEPAGCLGNSGLFITTTPAEINLFHLGRVKRHGARFSFTCGHIFSNANTAAAVIKVAGSGSCGSICNILQPVMKSPKASRKSHGALESLRIKKLKPGMRAPDINLGHFMRNRAS